MMPDSDRTEALASLRRAFKVWEPGTFDALHEPLRQVVDEAALFYVSELLDEADFGLNVEWDEVRQVYTDPVVTMWSSDTGAPETRDVIVPLAHQPLVELIEYALEGTDGEEFEAIAATLRHTIEAGILKAKEKYRGG